MSTSQITRLTKTVKRLEKPRPLKVSSNRNLLEGRLSSAEEVMLLVDAVSSHIANGNFDKGLQLNILAMSANMKVFGPQLEVVYKDQLDRAYVNFRTGTRDEHLDVYTRLTLLELVELRARGWAACDNMNNYYRPKLASFESELLPAQDSPALPGSLLSPISGSPTTTQPPVLSPGEVIKPSGKFAKPTKIPGKNYCKDEVVIRNSDSGKVNPGAKERLVQITGPHEDRISYAKQLIEDTIRRNASPIRLEQPEKERVGGSSSSLNSSASDDSKGLAQGGTRSQLLHSFSTNDASLGEYKYTVTIGNHSVKITGTNLDLVRTSKLVLDEYFSSEPEQSAGSGDYYGEYEEDPATPLAPSAGPPGLASRVSSLDSAATSESEETYKAVASAGEGQLLFLEAPRGAFTLAEQSEREPDASARNRRALFAQTSGAESGPGGPVPTTAAAATPAPRYTRGMLLEMALSRHSSLVPADWDLINREYPAIVKKATELFDPAVYSQKWQETDGLTSIICSTEVDSGDPE